MLLVIKSCRCDHIKLLLYLFFSFINNTTSTIQAGFRFHCLGFQTHNEKCCRHWYVLSSRKIALIIKYCKPIIIRACNRPKGMILFHRASYSVLVVKKLGARSCSTEFLSDVLHDDCSARVISGHRHITYSRYCWIMVLCVQHRWKQ